MLPGLLGPWVGTISDRHGPRWLIVVAFLSICPLMVFLRFVDHSGAGQVVLLCALLALLGVATTMCFVPLSTEFVSVIVAKEKRHPGVFGKGGAVGQAYALFNMSFAAGTVVGPIWAGLVVDRAGWATMGWSLGLLSIVTAIPTLLWAGDTKRG